MTSIDTLISNLSSQSNSKFYAALDYAGYGKQAAGGNPVSIGEVDLLKAVPYVKKESLSALDTAIEYPSDDVVGTVISDLTKYFDQFFPNVSEEYNTWVISLASLIKSGPSASVDNSLANKYSQTLDQANGLRAKREMRAAWASRGYCLPPGQMVGEIIDESDKRTEGLVAKAIAAADYSSEQNINAYKAIISTALSTSDARVAAVNAMAQLMITAASATEAYGKKIVMLNQTRAVAAKAAMAYYRAELELDALNAEIYNKSSGFVIQRFAKNADFFKKNESLQVSSAISAAETASKVAAAHFASLNTVASSATVSF